MDDLSRRHNFSKSSSIPHDDVIQVNPTLCNKSPSKFGVSITNPDTVLPRLNFVSIWASIAEIKR